MGGGTQIALDSDREQELGGEAAHGLLPSKHVVGEGEPRILI